MSPPIQYLDFDLQLQSTGDGFRSQVLNSPAGEASGTFSPIFTDLELENYLLKLGRPRRAHVRRIESPEGAAAKALGGRLFDAVFNDEVRHRLRRSVELAAGREFGLRIRLRLKDAPELVNYPWEYLYDRSRNSFVALSRETPVVRYLDLPMALPPLKVKLPLRILVKISDSAGCPRLDAEREWTLLCTALAGLQDSGQVVLERLKDATLETLDKGHLPAPVHVGMPGFLLPFPRP
jgi:hypothetical protein